MSPQERTQYLLRRLRDSATYAYAHNLEFQKRVQNAGLDAEGLKSFDDLEKLSIMNDPIPTGKLVSGNSWETALFAAGIRPGQGVLNALPAEEIGLAKILDGTVNSLSAVSIPAGMAGQQFQLYLYKDLKLSGIMVTHKVLRAMEAENFFPDDDAPPLTVILVTSGGIVGRAGSGFHLPKNINICRILGNPNDGCLAFECHHRNGFHASDNVYLEVIDLHTKQPLEDNITGQAVVTVLGDDFSIFRKNSLTSVYYSDATCSCGRTSRRILPS